MAEPLPRLLIERLPHARDLAPPAYQSRDAAGLDLRAAVDGTLTLAPGERAAVPSGLRMVLPVGHEGQVRPRSGLAVRHGVTCLNAPGTIDADYRGEVMVILVNLGNAPFAVERGMRIAQLVVAPVTRVAIAMSTVTDDTPRSSGGLGSTGL